MVKKNNVSSYYYTCKQPTNAIKSVNLRRTKIRQVFSRKIFSELSDGVQTSVTTTRNNSCKELDPVALSSIQFHYKPIMADLTQLKLSLTLDRENRKGKQICIYFMSRSLKTISSLLIRLKKISFFVLLQIQILIFFSSRIAKKISVYFLALQYFIS